MEPGVNGALKTSRKGVGIFDIALHGVEAHAGLDPENGASAVDELAHVILHLRSEQNPDVGTTINFGLVDGGTRSNVIPGRAHATMDVRVNTRTEAERIDKAVAAVRPVDDRIRLEITGGWNRPVMERTPQVGALFHAACELGSWLGLSVAETSAGGGSDANFLVSGGLPLLDGLGGVGAGAHSRSEHVRLTPTWEQVPLTAALLALYGLDQLKDT